MLVPLRPDQEDGAEFERRVLHVLGGRQQRRWFLQHLPRRQWQQLRDRLLVLLWPDQENCAELERRVLHVPRELFQQPAAPARADAAEYTATADTAPDALAVAKWWAPGRS